MHQKHIKRNKDGTRKEMGSWKWTACLPRNTHALSSRICFTCVYTFVLGFVCISLLSPISGFFLYYQAWKLQTLDREQSLLTYTGGFLFICFSCLFLLLDIGMLYYCLWKRDVEAWSFLQVLFLYFGLASIGNCTRTFGHFVAG